VGAIEQVQFQAAVAPGGVAASGPIARRHNARISGAGQTTLLFAHGFGCDQTVWREVTAAFEDRYRIVVFDHAGAGACDSSAYDDFRHSSLMGYAEDVLALGRELQAERLVLIGHSVSAMIGALAAIRQPDLFDLMVMIGPSACYLNDGAYRGGFDGPELEEFLALLETNFQGWGTALALLAMGNSDRPELADGLRDRICRTDPATAGVFARLTFFTDLRAEITRVTTPTVILECQDDPIAPDTATGFVHQAIPGSRLIRMAATGHCPHLSHPGEVVATLRDILDGERQVS